MVAPLAMTLICSALSGGYDPLATTTIAKVIYIPLFTVSDCGQRKALSL